MTYQSTGPLLARPQSPNPVATWFPDVDTRNTQSMEVIAVDECASFLIAGKKGGLKGVIWLSPDDALALAKLLTEKYSR